MSVEIRLVGFEMADSEELEQVVADALDSQGLKAAGYVVFDNSHARTCLDGNPYPHVVVASNHQEQLDTAALILSATLGVLIMKELCQGFRYPLPIDDWKDRGR